MPSTTFHHLPEEKKSRLLTAAWEEFSRVPLNDASINRIVKAAGIPRGSFYMYFAGKDDLLRYLLEDYQEDLLKAFGRSLKDTGGDVFKAYFRFVDYMLESCVTTENLSLFKNVVIHFLTNLKEPGLLPILPARLIADIVESADISGLNIESPEDVQHFVSILTSVTRDSIAELILGRKTIPEFKKSLAKKVEILKYGMFKRP